MMKKFYSLTKTLLAVALLCVGQNAWAKSSVWSEDFESATTSSIQSAWIKNGDANWGDTYSPHLELANNCYGNTTKYLFAYDNSTSRQRTGYYMFGSAFTGSAYQLDAKINLNVGNSSGESRFYIMNGSKAGTNADPSNYLFYIGGNTSGYVYVSNGTETETSTIGNAGDSENLSKSQGKSYKSTGWFNVSCIIDMTAGKVKVTITKGSDEETFTINLKSGTKQISGFGIRTGKALGGSVGLDDMALYELTAPAFTLSESSKTVSVDGSETVNVTDITGTISVSSNNTAAATASYDAGVVTINGVADGVATVTVTGTNEGLTLDKTIDVTVGSVATTDVTVNYLDENSVAIASPLVISDVSVGSILTASEVVYESVLYGVGCRYANPVLSESLPYTVVEDGVINITYTQQNSVASLNVKAQVGSTKYDIKSESLTGKYIGDVITITYPRLWLVGTTLYSTAQQAHGSDYFRWAYTLDGNDAVIEYNTTEATGVVYYSEGEDIEGMTADASGNADARCSGGKGGRSADELSLTTLEDGVYKLTSRVWGGAGYTYTYRAAGTDVLSHTTNGSLNDNNVYLNVMSGTAAIKVQGVNTGGKVLDYVYIQKIAESDGLIFNGDFSNSTWNAGWLGTGSDKKAAFVKQSSASGFDGNVAEMWTDAGFTAEGNIYQVLINVPAGDYVVSANILNNVAGGAAVLYAKVGSADDVTTAAAGLSTKTEKTLAFTVSEVSNVKIGYKTTNITGKTGWIAVDDFRFVVPATIGENEFTTFASTYPLDLTSATQTAKGFTAYRAASIAGSTVTFKDDVNQKVEANTGILLKGTAGATVYIPVAATGTALADNAFHVNTSGETFAAESGYTYYGMNKNSNPLTFGTFAPGTVAIPANKAYLKLNGSGELGARQIEAIFDDEILTGISEAEAATEAAQKEGKFIVDGKLVIFKKGMKFNANGQLVK